MSEQAKRNKSSKRETSSKQDKAGPPPLPEPLRVAVADSHTHLDMLPPCPPSLPALGQEGPRGRRGPGSPAESLAEAASVGVTTVIQVGCDLPGSRWAAELAAEQTSVWATVALHPNEAPRIVLGDPDGWSGQRRAPGGQEALDAALAEIDALAALPHVKGVGETGLDYHRTGEDGTAVQHESFRRHIDIAKRHGKALVIHDRDAHDDVLRILAQEGAPERVVFHCYSGDADMAKVCAEHGWFMSFAGNITFKSAGQLRDALAVAPLDLLLVETDAPFLTPVPYRGRPNAPYLIPITVRAMAQVRGIGEDELATALARNTARAFDYAPRP